MMKLLSFLIIIFSAVNIAQTFSVTGKVFEDKTNSPLSYANVRIEHSTMGTAANKNGEFQLKLNGGKYSLITSFIGYKSDTISIDVQSNINGLVIKLEQSNVNFPEIVVKPGHNPALDIIRNAINRKHERNKYLNSYEYQAYTKGVIRTNKNFAAGNNSITLGIGGNDTAALKIDGIIENESKGYFEKPGHFKEVILARKQTSNFSSSINVLTGGRLSQDFYRDDILFFDRSIPGPLSDDALSYYYFYIQKVLAIDKRKIYKIFVAPDNPSDPGFVGSVFITDSTFDLMKVDLQLNRAANTGGIFDSINVFQQFAAFNDSVFMPVDYRLFFTANFLGLARIGVELNTILYNYKINPKINEDLFNKAIITVLPNADDKDSTYWKNIQTIPRTREEAQAYKRIDSLTNVPRTFWDDFSPLSTTIDFSNEFSTSAPLGMYHFNRVEGNALSFGIFLRRAFEKRLNSSLQFDYGFSDKKLKTDFSSSYLFGDYRTYKLSLNAYNKLNILFGESEDYNELTSTALALLTKYEFRDYYYSKGFTINASGEVFPILKLNLGFLNRTDNNAFKNSDFSFFRKDQKFRSNPPIYETKVNALTAGFRLDFRNYIEDGFFRRRTSLGKSYIIFTGDITYSPKSFLKSGVNFTKYDLFTFGTINTFKSAKLNFRIQGVYNDGLLPYQMLYALPGNIDLASKHFTFRTLNVNEILGSRVVTLNLEHNFRDEIFKWLGIPGLKNWEIQLNTFLNAAYSTLGNETKNNLPIPVKEFKHPFYEIGFGLSHVLFPIELEFAWKLNYRNGNNFRIGLNTFVF